MSLLAVMLVLLSGAHSFFLGLTLSELALSRLVHAIARLLRVDSNAVGDLGLFLCKRLLTINVLGHLKA